MTKRLIYIALQTSSLPLKDFIIPSIEKQARSTSSSNMSTPTETDSVSLAVGLCNIVILIMVSATLGIMIGRKTAERTEG